MQDFVFVYLHFNVPPPRITDLVRRVSDKKIYWYGTITFVYDLLLSSWFVFSQFSSNKYSNYHFCIMIKDLSISVSREIIAQDFETITFNVTVTWNVSFVDKPTFSVAFCWMKNVRVSSQLNSLSILYMSTAKPFSLVRGHIEVKINKHQIWQSLFNQLWATCRVPLNECNPSASMALSCQNQIFMAQSYAQSLPKIAQRVKDSGNIRANCYFQMVNIEQGEVTWQVVTLKAVLHWKKSKLISPIELHCTN